MQRKRPPAFSRALADRLDRRDYPGWVAVYYGKDWSARSAHDPCLCIGVEYRPGLIDWGILAGLPVHVVLDLPDYPFELVAELANVTAPVIVQRTACDYESGQRDAEDYLYGVRHTILGLWSDAVRADYARRVRAYDAAMAVDLGL